MHLLCPCGFEFADYLGKACPRCGTVEGVVPVSWFHLHCECGHAEVRRMDKATLATCPACGKDLHTRSGAMPMDERPMAPPSESLVDVDGKSVAARAWEAEVMVRCVGWAAIARGLGIVVGGGSYAAWLGTRTHRDYAGPLLLAVCGGFMAHWGRLLFRRSIGARIGLIWANVFSLPCIGCALFDRRGSLFGPPMSLSAQRLFTAIFLPILLLPEAFSLFVLLRPGRAPVVQARRGAPLAPLRSIWGSGVNLRAWASLGVAFVALVDATLYACEGLGRWIRASS